MSNTPTQIWIRTAGKQPPEWVAAFMATGKFDDDGGFSIASPDGPVQVNVGDAIFVFGGEAYVCPPRLMQERLRSIAPTETAAIEAQKPPKPKPATSVAAPAPLKFKPIVGDPPAPQFVAMDKLLVDDSYQRSIEGGASKTLIRKIAINWDWRLCLPLIVSRRDGKLFVIDGQHRKEAAELRGDITHMPVVIFDFDDAKAEAELFVQANRTRRPMQRLDDFHASLMSGDKKAVAVASVVSDAGLAVARNSAWQLLKPGEVVFVAGVERGVKLYSREIAVAALKLMAAAFEGQPLLSGATVFDGLCSIISEGKAKGEPIEADLIEVVLAEVGIAGWREAVSGAENGDERREMMSRALRAAYDEAKAE